MKRLLSVIFMYIVLLPAITITIDGSEITSEKQAEVSFESSKVAGEESEAGSEETVSEESEAGSEETVSEESEVAGEEVLNQTETIEQTSSEYTDVVVQTIKPDEYYPNGRKKVIYWYSNGMLTGIDYYNDDSANHVSKREFYADGKIWQTTKHSYYPSGREYKRELIGDEGTSYKIYYDNDDNQIKTIVSSDGSTYQYDLAGNEIAAKVYRNGKIFSNYYYEGNYLFEENYENGIISEITRREKKQTATSETKTWVYENGKLQRIYVETASSQIVYNSNGVKVSASYSRTSTRKSDINYTYYSNGKVKTKNVLDDNQRLEYEYTSSGIIKRKIAYTSSKMMYYNFDSKGKLSSTKEMIYHPAGGIRSTVEKTYHSNGKVKIAKYYSMYEELETKKTYDSKGTITEKRSYTIGRLKSKVTYKSGKVATKVNYKYGSPSTKYVYKSGKIVTKYTYRGGHVATKVSYNSKGTVTEKRTYENGKLATKATYKSGKVSVKLSYNSKGKVTAKRTYKSGKISTKVTYKSGKVSTKVKYNSKGESTVKYTYNSKGKIIKTTRY